MSKAQELRDLTDEELEARYLDERKALFHLVNDKQQQGKQFEKQHKIPQTRRQIARMLTIMSEKQKVKGQSQ